MTFLKTHKGRAMIVTQANTLAVCPEYVVLSNVQTTCHAEQPECQPGLLGDRIIP